MAISLDQLPAEIRAQIPAGANVQSVVPAPGGGYLAVGADGGVFALGGAQFHGNYFDVPAQHRNDPNRRFTGIEAKPGGGYAIVSSTGEKYDFGPPAPAPNTLVTDPAYQAFQRTSGLGLETAAQNVARKRLAIDTALGQNIADTEHAGEQQRKGISGGFESRGVFRSGAHRLGLDEQERQQAVTTSTARTTAAGQIAADQEGLIGEVGRIQREAAEKGLSTAQTQDLDAGIEALRKKYPDAFASGLVR